MNRRERYENAIREYARFLTPYNLLDDNETPLKYLIIERKISYRQNQTIYMFQVYNYDSSGEFWQFIATQRSFQSSNKERSVFTKEKVIDLDTGDNVTEFF